MIIGRDSNNDHSVLRLELSRRHAKIENENNVWWIHDLKVSNPLYFTVTFFIVVHVFFVYLKSTNGLHVQGIPLMSGEKVILEDGFMVCFGPLKAGLKYTFHDNYRPSADIEETELLKELYFLKMKRNQLQEQVKEAKAIRQLVTQRENKKEQALREEATKVRMMDKYLKSLIKKYRTLADPRDSEDLSSSGWKAKLKNHPIVSSILSEMTCTICSEYFISPTSLNCSHVFCLHCIDEWKHQNVGSTAVCPNCRKEITSQTPVLPLKNTISVVLGKTLGRAELEERRQLIEERKLKPLYSQSCPTTSNTATIISQSSVRQPFTFSTNQSNNISVTHSSDDSDDEQGDGSYSSNSDDLSDADVVLPLDTDVSELD